MLHWLCPMQIQWDLTVGSAVHVICINSCDLIHTLSYDLLKPHWQFRDGLSSTSKKSIFRYKSHCAYSYKITCKIVMFSHEIGLVMTFSMHLESMWVYSSQSLSFKIWPFKNWPWHTVLRLCKGYIVIHRLYNFFLHGIFFSQGDFRNICVSDNAYKWVLFWTNSVLIFNLSLDAGDTLILFWTCTFLWYHLDIHYISLWESSPVALSSIFRRGLINLWHISTELN